MKHAYLLYTGYGKTKLVLDKIMNAKASRKPRTLLISTSKIVESSWSAEIDKWYPGQLTYSYITGKVPPKKRQAILDNVTDILGINTEMLDWYITNTCPIKSYRQKKDKEGKAYAQPVYDTTVIAKRFDLIVFDESSLFKSYTSSRFDNVKRFASIAPNVMILSATPTPKNN